MCFEPTMAAMATKMASSMQLINPERKSMYSEKLFKQVEKTIAKVMQKEKGGKNNSGFRKVVLAPLQETLLS